MKRSENTQKIGFFQLLDAALSGGIMVVNDAETHRQLSDSMLLSSRKGGFLNDPCFKNKDSVPFEPGKWKEI